MSQQIHKTLNFLLQYQSIIQTAKLIGTKNVEINSITVTNEFVTVVLQNATLERMQTKHRSHDDRRR